MTIGTGVKAHILIVDDDRLVLALLARGLEDAGYAVIEASDSAAALDVVQREKPDLALLDVRMPDMSGLRLAEILSSQHGVPFMFLSAYDDSPTIARATALGALGYLVKPLDVPHIVPSIEAALGRAEQIRALRNTGQQLNHALEAGREISIAVGILMERLRMSREAALDHLRSLSRSQRRRMEEVSSAIVAAAETINATAPRRPDER